MRQRLRRGGQGVGGRLARRWDVGLVLMLCLGVILQMLGVGAPLLDAGGIFDIGESSIQEGWSIHTSNFELRRSFCYVLIHENHRSMSVPILAGAVFRPPLS